MNKNLVVVGIIVGIISVFIALAAFVGGALEAALIFLILAVVLLGSCCLLYVSNKKVIDQNKQEYSAGTAVDVTQFDFEKEKSSPYDEHDVYINRKKKYLGGGVPVYVIIGRDIFSYVLADKEGFTIGCKTKKMVFALAWFDPQTNRFYFSKEYVLTSNGNVKLQVVNGKKTFFELVLAEGVTEYNKNVTLEERELPLKWYGYWSDLVKGCLPKKVEYALRYKHYVDDGGHIHYFLNGWGLTDKNDNEIFYTAKPILEQVLPTEFMANLILAYEQFLKIRDNFKKEAPELAQSQFDELAEKFKTYDEYFYEHENELINAILKSHAAITVINKTNW